MTPVGGHLPGKGEAPTVERGHVLDPSRHDAPRHGGAVLANVPAPPGDGREPGVDAEARTPAILRQDRLEDRGRALFVGQEPRDRLSVPAERDEPPRLADRRLAQERDAVEAVGAALRPRAERRRRRRGVREHPARIARPHAGKALREARGRRRQGIERGAEEEERRRGVPSAEPGRAAVAQRRDGPGESGPRHHREDREGLEGELEDGVHPVAADGEPVDADRDEERRRGEEKDGPALGAEPLVARDGRRERGRSERPGDEGRGTPAASHVASATRTAANPTTDRTPPERRLAEDGRGSLGQAAGPARRRRGRPRRTPAPPRARATRRGASPLRRIAGRRRTAHVGRLERPEEDGGEKNRPEPHAAARPSLRRGSAPGPARANPARATAATTTRVRSGPSQGFVARTAPSASAPKRQGRKPPPRALSDAPSRTARPHASRKRPSGSAIRCGWRSAKRTVKKGNSVISFPRPATAGMSRVAFQYHSSGRIRSGAPRRPSARPPAARSGSKRPGRLPRAPGARAAEGGPARGSRGVRAARQTEGRRGTARRHARSSPRSAADRTRECPTAKAPAPARAKNIGTARL